MTGRWSISHRRALWEIGSFAGETAALVVLALFRALGMLLCAALAPGAILSAGGWSEAMARGDNRVCFARVGTGRSAASAGQSDPGAADAQVCVDKLDVGTSREAGHFCGGHFCAWTTEETFGNPGSFPIASKAARRKPDGDVDSPRLLPISVLRDVPYGSGCWFYALVRRDGTGAPKACGGTKRVEVHDQLTRQKLLTKHAPAAT